MKYSLRNILLFTLLSASALIWGVTAYVSYRLTRDEVVKLFDAELAQSAHALYSFVGHLLYEGSLNELWDLDSPEKILTHSTFNSKYTQKIAFQLISKTEGLILRSRTAPVKPMSDSLNGFTKMEIDGYLWHVFSISDDKDEYIIHVGQRDDVRRELKDEIVSHLIKPLLFSLPFLGVVIGLIVRRALKPVNRLTLQLARREANYLKPLSTRHLPTEIVPVVEEINTLYLQLEKAFENERRFTADASHELKTPLAGLLTQAQVAMKTSDEGMRQQALGRIEQAVKRMTNMVQQLLTFSRIESDPSYLNKQYVELSREVIQIIAELEPEAHKKQISMSFEHNSVAHVKVNVPLIGILIRNILDNAVKYTPRGGKVVISLTQRKALELCVEDSGPGIAIEQYDDAYKRFYRCIETANKVQGTGLGLSMVQRISLLHNAELHMDKSRFGGLKLTVLFPLLPEANPVKNAKNVKKPLFGNVID